MTTSSAPRYKRRLRNYLINPRFQLTFMLYMVIMVLIGFSIMYTGNGIYFDAVNEMGAELDLHESHPYFEFIEAQRKLLLQTYLSVASLVFAFMMLAGLILSHRIAGPIYRIERYLEEVAEGATVMRPVHLREGDFFPEIAGIINNAVSRMQNEIDALRAGKDDLR